jgi:hypothetical protein
MVKVSREKPEYFTPEDMQKIQMNAVHFN